MKRTNDRVKSFPNELSRAKVNRIQFNSIESDRIESNRMQSNERYSTTDFQIFRHQFVAKLSLAMSCRIVSYRTVSCNDDHYREILHSILLEHITFVYLKRMAKRLQLQGYAATSLAMIVTLNPHNYIRMYVCLYVNVTKITTTTKIPLRELRVRNKTFLYDV